MVQVANLPMEQTTEGDIVQTTVTITCGCYQKFLYAYRVIFSEKLFLEDGV